MFDVIIIGAGLSGLTAAYKILQKEPSLRLQILEATNRIGGQLGCAPSGEIGGKWILAEQYHIFKLLTDLRVPMRRKAPVSKDLSRVYDIDEGYFAFAVNFELRRYIDELDLRARLYRPGNCNSTLEDKGTSMWDHIRGKLFFEGSRKFMANFVRLVTGTDARDISYAQFMNVINSCGGTDTLFSMYDCFRGPSSPLTDVIRRYLGSSTVLIEFSSDHLLRALETRLKEVEIRKCSKVTEVHHQADMVTIRCQCGEYHTGRVCVLAIPWNQVCEVFITPPIPSALATESPSSKCFLTSFIAEYDEAHWRRNGKSGSLYSSEPALYTQQYRPTSLCGYVLHESGIEQSAPTLVLKKLSESFGHEMAHPLSYFQRTFEQSCLMTLPQKSPWNRVVWSSSCSATLFRGCLSGAVQGGLRAAVQTLLILRPQNVSWRDLAEIQKADAVYQLPSVSDLFRSSLNIYNTMFYSGVGLIVVLLLKLRKYIF